jgi:hypothetical protein
VCFIEKAFAAYNAQFGGVIYEDSALKSWTSLSSLSVKLKAINRWISAGEPWNLSSSPHNKNSVFYP